jgi:S1-C subfamily serine protease
MDAMRDPEIDESRAINLGATIASAVRRGALAHYPDIADLFPFGRAWSAELAVGNGVWLLRLRDRPELQVPQSELFAGVEPSTIGALLTGELSVVELGEDPRWRSAAVFAHVGKIEDPPYWGFHRAADEWMVRILVPAAFELNRQRILRVVPEAPSWQPEALRSATFVVETNVDGLVTQGTAFRLESVGIVTCAHCVADGTLAYLASDPAHTYPVRVLRSHPVVDLAVIEVDGLEIPALPRGDVDGLGVMSAVAVVGYPNHRTSDWGVFKPGLIAGSGTHSGVRRWYTNIGIVAGMSGAPAVDRNGCVIGVAVTGADSDAMIETTDKHAFIPIDALDLLAATEND